MSWIVWGSSMTETRLVCWQYSYLPCIMSKQDLRRCYCADLKNLTLLSFQIKSFLSTNFYLGTIIQVQRKFQKRVQRHSVHSPHFPHYIKVQTISNPGNWHGGNPLMVFRFHQFYTHQCVCVQVCVCRVCSFITCVYSCNYNHNEDAETLPPPQRFSLCCHVS